MTNKFKIKLARVESTPEGADEPTVCMTFLIDRGPVGFHVPIFLDKKDFDDTEIVAASRNALHGMFVELAAQTQKWKLTEHEVKLLSGMNSRRKKLPGS